MSEMVYDPTTTTVLKLIDLLHNLVILFVKLVIDFVGINGLENLWPECSNRIRLDARVCGLQKLMFSDRYHLSASTLARVCSSMTGFMQKKTSSNRCRASLLLLLSNVFLKIRAVYFKADSNISGTFHCSTWSVDAPPTCTSSTINFLGAEGTFVDEVGPFSVVWCNCRLGAFSQLLKWFSKLLVQLMALPQWRHFPYLMKVHSGSACVQLR